MVRLSTNSLHDNLKPPQSHPLLNPVRGNPRAKRAAAILDFGPMMIVGGCGLFRRDLSRAERKKARQRVKLAG